MSGADVFGHTVAYVRLAALALALGGGGGFLAGLLAAHVRPLRVPIMALCSLARVVPSLAVLTFMLPLLGLGFTPALAALSLLAAAPVAITTDLALRSVPAAATDAANGLGMTARQVLLRVSLPLARPVIYSGIRIAMTEVIASAVLAAFVGAGGLGEYITTGLQANDAATLWSGVALIAAIAIAAEILFALLTRRTGTFA